MKKSILNLDICSAILLGLITLALSNSGQAQTLTGTPPPTTVAATRTIVATATGSITHITPDLIIIKTDGDPAPVGYALTKDTVYIDDQEAPVQMSVVKPGRAVMVYYVVDGKNKVATKVLVRNAP